MDSLNYNAAEMLSPDDKMCRIHRDQQKYYVGPYLSCKKCDKEFEEAMEACDRINKTLELRSY